VLQGPPLRVRLERLVQQVLQAPLELLAPLALLVPQELRELLGLQELRELSVLVVVLGLLEPPVRAQQQQAKFLRVKLEPAWQVKHLRLRVMCWLTLI